jgi:predicted nucleic acid-binding protein
VLLYYLDSSAWVKRYFDEARSQVRNLFVQHDMLSCSPLGLIEVGSTLARKRAAGEIRPAEFGPKRTSLLQGWRRFLQMEQTPAVVQRALDAGDAYGLRGADSVHLASALILKEALDLDSQEFAFVTSDLELKTAALKAGLAVLDPQEQRQSLPE